MKFFLIAQAAADAAGTGATESVPMWLQVIMGLLGLVITRYAVPLLAKKNEEAAAAIKKAEADTANAQQSTRSILMGRVKSFLLGEAQRVLERDVLGLVQEIKDGKIPKSKEAIKHKLYGLGKNMKSDAIEYFGTQGVDLVGAVGDKFLDKLVDRAADAVSPFPGKETAVELLKDKVTDKLLEKGMSWVKDRYLEHGDLPEEGE